MDESNRVERLQTLIQIAGEIQARHSIETILSLITESAVKLMNSESCIILFKEEHSGERKIQAFLPGAEEKFSQEDADIASALFVPVSIGENTIGSLQVINSSYTKQYSMEDLDLFQAFANLSSIALNNAALTRSLNEKIEALEKQNKELIETRNHLVNSEKLGIIGQMAAGFSHEIRNLITPIRLIAEDPPEKDNFNIDAVIDEYKLIAEQVNKAMNMATGFLSFSRQGHESNSAFDINDIASKAINLVSHRFKHEAVKLETDFKENLPKVMGIAVQLEQVIVNLINNADDAMKGSGTIRISTDLALNDVILKIADNGSGIKPEDLKRIMEPFFTTKSEKQGTGLGLTICAHIMEQHKGRLIFESEWGHGTTATLTLPAKKR